MASKPVQSNHTKKARRLPAEKSATNPNAKPLSRTDRGRIRRERAMERQFAWAFVITVLGTTFYLFDRSPWGIALIHWPR